MDTAAMEAILTDLLKEARAQGKEQSAMFVRLAKAAGLDPKLIKEAEARLKDLGDSAEEAAASQSKLGKAGNIVGSALADLASGIGSTIGNLIKFSTTTLSGKAQMSDLFGAFKDLPIIGHVASLFSGLQKLQEENMSVYRSLTTTGINFGGNLNDLRRDFIGMGLTADSYTRIMNENSEAFTLMGKSTTAGATLFKQVNKELVNNNQQLLRLGMSYEELNQTTASYVKVSGGLSQAQQRDYKAVAESVTAYGKELDLIARLTGKSRQEQEKQLEKASLNAAWQAKLASMDAAGKEKANTALQKAMAVGGQDAMEALQSQFLGFGPMTEGAQTLTGILPNVAKNMRDLAGTITMSGTAAEVKAAQDKIHARALHAARGDVERLGKTADAFAFSVGDSTANVVNSTRIASNQLIASGDMTVEQTEERIKQERAQLETTANNAATQAAQQLAAEEKIRNFALQMVNLLDPLLQLMKPIGDLLMEKMGEFTVLLANAMPSIREFVNNLFTPAGREKIANDLWDLLKSLFKTAFEKLNGGSATFLQKAGAQGVGYGIAGAGMGALMGGVPTGGIGAGPGAALGFGVGMGWGFLKQAFESFAETMSGRALTSFGATGNAFENFGSGSIVKVHGEEGVFNPAQINNLMANAGAESLKQVVNQLNSSNAEMIYLMRQIAENSGRNVDATKALSGDMYA